MKEVLLLLPLAALEQHLFISKQRFDYSPFNPVLISYTMYR